MTITSQVRSFAIGLVACTAGSIGLVVYWGYTSIIATEQRQTLERYGEVEAKRLHYAFQELSNDVRLLAGLPGVRGLSRFRDTDSAIVQSRQQRWKDGLAAVFTEMLRAKSHYVQIRLIGVAENGRELVRVDRHMDDIQRIAEQELQQKGGRSYFQEAIRLRDGQLYLSQINLNREQGLVEIPYRPVLRAAIPVSDSAGEPFGIVIINLNFASFFDELYPSENLRDTYYLANAAGDFLVHPNPDLTYGFDFGKRYRVPDEFPSLSSLFDAADSEETVRVDALTVATGELVHFRKVHFFDVDESRHLFLGIATNHDEVARSAAVIGGRATLITTILLAFAMAAAYLLTSRLTRPLNQITAAAQQIAEGGSNIDLPVDRRDETGTLARVFEQMLSGLKEKEQRIQATNRSLQQSNIDLEHFAHVASHDLREPARRVAGMADLLMLSEGDGVSTEGRDLLLRIQGAANKMLDQISDFRVLAEIGQGTLLRRTMNMEELVRSVLDEFSNELESRRIVVDVEALPTLDVYESLTRVLYRNLIVNAIQHASGAQMRLLLTAEESTAGEADWILGVRNTGSQIAEDHLVNVFAPFTRLETATSGNGMGLSVCKRIIDRHSGQIWAESGTDYVHFRFSFGKEEHGCGSDN